MNHSNYKLTSSSDFSIFRFTSIGVHGCVPNAIIFRYSNNPLIFNLSFGPVIENFNDGEISINDAAVSSNGDRNKILATVARAIYKFTELRPKNYVLFTGSSPSRTRLYRIAISLNFREISKTFYIFGIVKQSNHSFKKIDFDCNIDMCAFLIKRK